MAELKNEYDGKSTEVNGRGETASAQNARGAEASPYVAPSITLPKGGGAIRGMGEKFAANPVTGIASMSVPIAVSPGRSGFSPQLSLTYDSGAGNGPFGFGWNLALPTITRKTDKGLPKYQDATESDVFILSGAEDLAPLYKKDSDGSWTRDGEGKLVIDDLDRDGYHVRRYRPRIEGLFARVERWTRKSDGDVHGKQGLENWSHRIAARELGDSPLPTIFVPDVLQDGGETPED